MVTPIPHPAAGHYRTCMFALDLFRRRRCTCAELALVYGPKEQEARLLKLAAAMVPGESK